MRRTNQLVALTSAYTSLMGEVIVIVIQCVTAPEPSGKKKCPRLIDLAAAPRFTNLRHHKAFSAWSHAWQDVSLERVVRHELVGRENNMQWRTFFCADQ